MHDHSSSLRDFALWLCHCLARACQVSTHQMSVGSEQTQSSSVEIALRALDNAIDLFDEIFYEIAPVHAYNEPNKGEGVLIPFRSLTDKQCHVVKELSGHLVNARKCLVGRRPSEVQSPARSPSSATTSISNTFMEQKMGMLRDYLMHELARSESAELQLKAKEDDLVNITVECEKLKKKIATMTAAAANQANQIKNEHHGGAHNTHSSSRAASVDRIDTQPESYVYSYVRKQFADSYFFGIIAQYDATEQFFQIVYEDADYEDITHSELRRIMWPNSTPSAKREACLKHAKLLGMITPEQYATLHAELKSGGKSGSSNNNGSNNSSNGNNGNNSSSSSASSRATSSIRRAGGCMTSAVEDSPTTTKGDDDIPLGDSIKSASASGPTTQQLDTSSVAPIRSSLHLLTALSSCNGNNNSTHTDNHNGSKDAATTSSTSSLQKLQQLVARTATATTPTTAAITTTTSNGVTGPPPASAPSTATTSASVANTTTSARFGKTPRNIGSYYYPTIAASTSAPTTTSGARFGKTRRNLGANCIRISTGPNLDSDPDSEDSDSEDPDSEDPDSNPDPVPASVPAPAPANPLGSVSGSKKVPPPAKSQQLKGNSKHKAIPQHALINAHFAPVASTATAVTTAATTAATKAATTAATTTSVTLNTAVTKHTSINDIVAASGIAAANPVLAATPTVPNGSAAGYAHTSPNTTAHSVTSSVRTNNSVSAAGQRGGEEGITFLHSTTPTQVSASKTVTSGTGTGSSGAVRSVATGKGQPSFGSVTKPSPTVTAAPTTPAVTQATAVPNNIGTTQSVSQQPSKRKAEDKADGKNAAISAQESSLHKKMRSNSDDMAIIAPPVKVIEIIEID